MTYGGYGGGPTGPYGNDPFGGQQGGYGQQGGGYGPPGGGFPPGPPGPPGGPPGFPPGPGGFGPQYPGGPQQGTNTLATLSMPFGLLLPPVGVVLGHIGLSQTKKTGQPGRQRALIGLTLGYLMIFVWIIVLVVWLVMSNNSGSSSDQTTSTTSKTSTTKKKTTTSRTTTRRSAPRSTAPPAAPPGGVSLADLRPGDCLLVIELGDDLRVGRAPCIAGPDVYRVEEVLSTKSCRTPQVLVNRDETLFACITPLS